MSNPQNTDTPKMNLEELKERLSHAQEVVVDPSGQLFKPDDPNVVGRPPQSKTVLKPQRWF